MKKCLLWVLLLGACSPLTGQLAHAGEKPPCEPWAAKIAAVQGKVEAKRTSDENWHTTTRNTIYCPGDQIRVGKNARASIILINDTLIRLDEYSVITLTQIKAEEPSLLDLIKGIAHFISRVPRSLKVNTPFVNAAIEGTEFVVAVTDADATVTVFEGKVLTANENGQVRLIQNESAITRQGQAPEKILLARPRDTVQWALYFPPIIKADAEGNPLQQASSLLYKGRVEEASKLLTATDNKGEARALLAIIAIVNNDRDAAFKLASEAVLLAPDAAATHIAMSYAWQAKLNLDAALASAQQAVNKETDNAIAWARLAELQLSVGLLKQAQRSATKATELDQGNARAQTILGYAYLTQIRIQQAHTSFEKAIELDQNDPLPHLGLGLAMIRKNELAAGRRQIEIAASLDPNNAIIRSYLGKAYYEEKRAPLDAEQFAMAKQLDPNDPTPYFYDAIRKQTENNPVGALEDLNKSIELNDNRAVYRSTLQLDQDEAARNANASRIYQELGYEQLAINHASKSITQDPTNYSAHELLANSYLSKPKHEIARVSETLQAKLLNPLNSNPQQPQLTQGSLTLLNNLGPNISANNEYNQLFQSDDIALTTNVLLGGNNTEGYEGIVSGVYDWFAFSFGKYLYDTDGYHANNGQDQTLDNYFLQAKINNNLSIFFEREEKYEILGDRLRFYPTNFSSNLTTLDVEQGNRVGLRYKVSPEHTFLATYLNHARRYTQTQSFGVAGNLYANSDDNDDVKEIRYLLNLNKVNLTLGYSETNIDKITSTFFNATPLAPTGFSTIEDSKGYFYSTIVLPPSVDLTIGYAYETYKTSNFDIKENNPKLGVIWSPQKSINLRIAYIESLRKTDTGFTTIEPTMVAGFNQFYDDEPGAQSEQIASAIDFHLTDGLTIGLEHIYRDLNVPQLDGSFNTIFLSMSEKTTSAFAYWTINSWIAFNLKAQREKFIRGSFTGNLTYEDVETYRFPVGINFYFRNRFSANIVATYIQQKGNFIDNASSNPIPGKDNFWNIDLSLNYLIPNRDGSITFGVKNILGEEFNYEETDRKNPTLAPETVGYARINLNF